MSQGRDRFFVNLQAGKTAEETCARLTEQLLNLTQQLNQTGIPLVVGPFDSVPRGLKVNQIVVDWSSGTSVIKVWNGNELV